MEYTGLGKELECSVCLSLYTDPVTLRCGHNYCRVCIDQFLNTQDSSGVYSCPECRADFQERPALQRNITLCKVMENFLSTHRVKLNTLNFCSYCLDSPVPAVKSCLLCEASLCHNHLRAHSKTAEHVLTEPRTSLQDRKCSIHKKILEYFCIMDAACICVSCCLIGEHQGHKMESLDVASEKKKESLRNILQKLTTKRLENSEKIWSLEERRIKTQEKEATEVKSVNAFFADIRRWLDNLEKKVLSEISRQKDQVSLSLMRSSQKLETEMDELSRKIRHIEELCNMTDPLTVLQDLDTGDLSDLKEEKGGEDTWGHDEGDRGVEMISHISQTLSDMIRDANATFYVQGSAEISLDEMTADNNIHISNDGKIATWTRIEQNRPETSERFLNLQVISKTFFISGRHYWDVEISESKECMVGICYACIHRRGPQSYIGDNKNSWCLHGELYDNQCSVIHDGKVIRLPHQITSGGQFSGARFRIFLDYEAGQLSFYELCEPIRHLYTFTATFTEPLYAAFYVWKGCIKLSGEEQELSGKMCELSAEEQGLFEVLDVSEICLDD
ncbi:E3 ubiquitin/ISG15 ligase TRIM25-like [Bufo gargarizans]|uniref:E3 ubiquitin/ISG15 ligase TRIM25-like n=1 Tax=Bufo gargarizans TaxID=30331 RepID=UPI001CF541EF|nr:E3 ubiquitin/ISG15 ligase TRIM25-like [Bufo gargarizans]